jgi:hypothetical protein
MSIKTMLPTYFPPPPRTRRITQEGNYMMTSFITPLPEGFQRYRIRYKIHHETRFCSD